MQSRPFHEPPVATAASWSAATRRVTITFNLPIQATAFNLANWRLTHAGGTANPSSATVAGGGLQIVLQFASLMGVSLIGFDPPPFDVIGAPPNGLAVQAFSWPL